MFEFHADCSTVPAGSEVFPGCDPPVPIRAQPVARRPGVGTEVMEATSCNQGEVSGGGGDQEMRSQCPRAGAGL